MTLQLKLLIALLIASFTFVTFSIFRFMEELKKRHLEPPQSEHNAACNFSESVI